MSSEISDYGSIVESWVRDFHTTMCSSPEVGDRSGDEPEGVKIIFESFGYNDETDEHDDTNTFHFAVFVHKDSLTSEEFPEHDYLFGTIIHRPAEEVCIHCYLDVENDIFDFNPFEDSDLDHEQVCRIILNINERDHG